MYVYCQIGSINSFVKLLKKNNNQFVGKHLFPNALRKAPTAAAAAAAQAGTLEHRLRRPHARGPVMYAFIWHLSASLKG